MKILVTGSSGTLGSKLVTELLIRGHEVWGCDIQHQRITNYVRADVGNYRQMERVFRTEAFDYIYHLAAEFGRINGEEYYDTLWQTNVVGTRNILELQRVYGFNLIFSSSSEIYGDSFDVTLHEDLPLNQPLTQTNDYAISKWVNEQQIMNFETRYGNKCVRLRFFNSYGEGELYHNYRSVVCLFCYRALHGIPWEVYEGYHRVFLHVDDFIPTLANVCENFKAGEVYNIGGQEYRSVKELSDLVLDCTGAAPSLVTYLPEDKHNVLNKRPDIEKAREAFNHYPKITLEVGIPKTIDWMRKIYGKDL